MRLHKPENCEGASGEPLGRLPVCAPVRATLGRRALGRVQRADVLHPRRAAVETDPVQRHPFDTTDLTGQLHLEHLLHRRAGDLADPTVVQTRSLADVGPHALIHTAGHTAGERIDLAGVAFALLQHTPRRPG